MISFCYEAVRSTILNVFTTLILTNQEIKHFTKRENIENSINFETSKHWAELFMIDLVTAHELF